MPTRPGPRRGFHGVVGHLRARGQGARALGPRAPAPDTLVIADEAHHLGRGPDLGRVVRQRRSPQRPRWLLLSGTPFRSDATPIPGVSYDADGMAEPDVSYSYAEAVADGGLPPGVLRRLRRLAVLAQRRRRDRVQLRDRALHPRGQPPLPHRDLHRAARRAAADPAEADAKLEAIAPGRPPRRGRPGRRRRLRARAADRQAAARGDRPGRRWWCSTPRRGRPPSWPRSPARRDPWIVAVNMVSEGVDIPRLRVGVYATAAKTPLDLPPDRRALRAHDPRPPGRAELALRPRRPDPARPRGHDRDRSCAARCAGPARPIRGLDERARAAADRALRARRTSSR